MNILVIGATGGTGKELVKQALERGHNVTALVRTPSKVTLVHPNLKIVQGDVLTYETVYDAMKSQHAVLCALGHTKWFYPNRILSDGTQNIIRAMQAHNVKRLIVETALGVGNSFGKLGLYYTLFVYNFILPFYFWDKHRQERVVKESGLDWIIVRPGQLINSPARGKYRHGEKVGNYLWTVRISRADVAGFMLNQLTVDTYLHKAVGISN